MPGMTTSTKNSTASGIFQKLHFVVVRSATLKAGEAKDVTSPEFGYRTYTDCLQIARRLQIHGGEAIVDEYPEQNLDLDSVTHIISNTSDFPGYRHATDSMIPVIKPSWIEECIGKQRLVHTRQYNPDPRYFMSDVVVCCADIPEGDADAIAGGVLAMGGNFTTKVTGQTTHIVALSLDNAVCDTASHRGWVGKFVIPHWFDDCLKLGRKIDEKPYELPDPEILRTGESKPPYCRQSIKSVQGAMIPHPSQDPVVTARNPISIFTGKIFKLSNDLGIGPYLRGVLDGIIEASKGQVTDDVNEANFYICRYREGSDYKIASNAGIDVGNLAWLYYLITHGQWTSPLRRLLHYPVSRTALPGFKGLKISLSNYSGEARAYLEHLIIATGAECTKTLRQENTHLITAHDQSEKCAAAREWNVAMINHLWLEESYAQWRMLSVTVPKYTHFPQRTNLSEIVGQTQIDRDVIKSHFLNSDEDVEMTDAPPPTAATKNDMLKPSNPTLKNSGATGPTNRQPKGKTKKSSHTSGPAERKEFETPSSKKYVEFGQENMTPATTASRKSKQLATEKLQNLTPDIALYEKERKRTGGVVYGGRRKGEGPDNKASRKRSADPPEDEDSDTTEMKKRRKGPATIVMHLLVSGYKRWVGKAKEEDADLKKLRDLGIAVVTDASKATHVAVPHIIRTPKFIVALAYAPFIISTDFIDACLDKDEYLNPQKFKLKDIENEKKVGLSLEMACERAKENKQQLLAGRSIYVVENISGGFETYQGIVEANGGQCMIFRGRPGSIIPSKRAGSELSADEDPASEVHLISSDTKEDKRVWSRFVKMVEGSRKVPRIVKSDWILDTAMCQKLQPTASYELDSAS